MLGAGPGHGSSSGASWAPLPRSKLRLRDALRAGGCVKSLLDGSGAGTASFRHEHGAHTRRDGLGLAASYLSVCVRALSGKRAWHLFLLV